MIVSLNYLKSYAQNGNDSIKAGMDMMDVIHPLRGADTIYIVSKTDLINANKGLLFARKAKRIIPEYESIINNQKYKLNLKDSLWRENIKVANKRIVRLEKQIVKANKRKNIWASTAIGGLALFCLTIIIK